MPEIEIDVILERLQNLIDQNKEAHDMLFTQIQKANGAITSLKMWRSAITGGLLILSSIVIPMALMVFGRFLDK